MEEVSNAVPPLAPPAGPNTTTKAPRRLALTFPTRRRVNEWSKRSLADIRCQLYDNRQRHYACTRVRAHTPG